MSSTLREVAEKLRTSNKKVQLIYAFNSTGKTRLSREFRYLISPKNYEDDNGEQCELARTKILYYNAFTEDLFYWDNDLELDDDPKLKIQPNTFTDWILKDQGQDRNIVTNFQNYTNEKLTPHFNEEYLKDESDPESKVKAFSEVTFSLERGDNEVSEGLKISKGEESNFIWSVFYTLLDQVVSVLNVVEVEDRETNEFDQLEYVFIDDPVSSLDENHLIELAVNLAGLIKTSNYNNGQGIKFIISTHNPLFYNVLYNEIGTKDCYLLTKFEDGSFDLKEKRGDSNKSFSYHLYLKEVIEQAIESNDVQRYHFTLLRNLYEKTANFLGYPKWSELLPGDKEAYLNRIIQFSSHRTMSNEEVGEPTEAEKQTVKFLLDNLVNNYGFWQQGEQNG